MLGLETQLCAELPLESDGASELRASLASFVLVPYSCTRTLVPYSFVTQILTDRLGQRRPSGAACARQYYLYVLYTNSNIHEMAKFGIHKGR